MKVVAWNDEALKCRDIYKLNAFVRIGNGRLRIADPKYDDGFSTEFELLISRQHR